MVSPARDIQAWEYVPLGPFLGKSFGKNSYFLYCYSPSRYLYSVKTEISKQSNCPILDECLHYYLCYFSTFVASFQVQLYPLGL